MKALTQTKHKSYSVHSHKSSRNSTRCRPIPTSSSNGMSCFPEGITSLLADFERCLEEVLAVCRQRSLASRCENNYQNLLHRLSHFFSLHSQKDELYKNSIDMKEKLLEKLRRMNEEKLALEKKAEDVYKKMRKRVMEKDEEVQKWKDLVLELEEEKEALKQRHMASQQKELENQNEIRNQKMELQSLQEQLKGEGSICESEFERFLLVQAESIERLLASRKRLRDDTHELMG